MDGDVLTAATLLATAVALLYTAWSPEVSAALALDRTDWPVLANRTAPIGQISRALRNRAWPLAAVAGLQALILLPAAWGAMASSVEAAARGGAHYDAVRAALVAVWTTMLLLALAAAQQVLGLLRHLRDFRTEG